MKIKKAPLKGAFFMTLIFFSYDACDEACVDTFALY